MLATMAVSGAVRAQTAWYEGFEGPERSWQEAGGNAQYRIAGHGRVQDEAHTGDGCERLTIYGDGGTHVYFAHDVGRARVIDELLPTVWVKANRAGLQVLARVVLPRTIDTRTGGPVSTLLGGSLYNQVGRWQQLRIDRVPRLLARQIRVLRSQLGPQVDGREAYVDRILLNVYGGPGTTHVWIDDLDIGGYVGLPPAADQNLPPAADWAVAPGKSVPGADRPPERSTGNYPSNTTLAGSALAGGALAGSASAAGATRRRVELAGSVLTADGHPFFPRIIRHRGESPALLKELGFNTIWLDLPATPALLAEAARLDLWVICPPPGSASAYVSTDRVTSLGQIGPEYDCVLAWDLGRGLTKEQLESTRGWAQQVRLADRRRSRPLVCLPDGQLRAYGRLADLLLLERRPLGTSLELSDFGRWIRRQSQLAPATSFWTTIQTQPSEALRRQLAALEPGRQPPISVPSEQIRLLSYTAVASGSRGLLFDSQTPLDATDPQTRRRAMALELLNLELKLIEPWAAAGSVVASVGCKQPAVSGTVLRVDRSRLLLPIWTSGGAQHVPDQSAANALSLVLPGVPESSAAYLMSPGGLEPLRHERVTGGVRVSMDEFGLTAAVLLTQDPLAIDNLAKRCGAIGRRAATLQRQLAVEKLSTVQEVAGQLAGSGIRVDVLSGKGAGDWIDAARKSLQSCDGHLAGRSYAAAYLSARRAMRSLRLVESAYWKQATENLGSPLSSPTGVSFAALPWHAGFVRAVSSGRWASSQLGGGDFESLPAVLGAGWNHLQHSTAGLTFSADLSPAAAHSGFSGLRLKVRAEDPKRAPAVIESPPVWITSPAVPVEAGEVVCIEGWVWIPKAITGSLDGLMIIDSLSGEALAERIGRTRGWKQFAIYRVAPQSGTMTVTFALSGLGEVRLDDVTIRRMRPGASEGVTRLPRSDSPAASRRAIGARRPVHRE